VQNYEQQRYASEGHAASGNLWVRREIFEALEGFNAGLRRGGDTEFSARAAAEGHAIAYAEDVEVAHPPVDKAGHLARRAYRDGREAGRRGSSRLAHRLRHGAYVPTASLAERLARAGHPTGPLRLAGVVMLKQVALRLPLLVGNLVGLASSRVSPAQPPAIAEADDERRKESERRFHDVQYDEDTRGAFRRFYEVTRGSREPYEQFLAARAEGSRTMEIGCGGDGGFGLVLAARGAQVLGVDLSPVAVEQAREAAARKGVQNATFEVMDAECFDLPDDSMDLIFGSGVLHHLDLERAYAEIARVLRPGGSAIFREPMGHNPALRLFRRLTPRSRTPDEHPLKLADLRAADHDFGGVRCTYHHLLGLAAFPLRGTPLFEPVLAALDRLDAALFRRSTLFARQCWLVLIRLDTPRR
nr:methyltransferase domain-containing protein [Solirubrobacterales bacterium]